MSDASPPRDPELHELLNAYLDGELDERDEQAVHAYVARSADARAELDALAAVRLSVRSLGPVEPPPGFIEALLREGAADTEWEDEGVPAGTPRLHGVPTTPPGSPGSPASSAPEAKSPFQRSAAEGGGATVRRAAARRRGPSFGRVAAAVGAAAAAVVLLLGVTPATDAIVPPVQAFAARHDQMMASPPVPGPGGSTGTSSPTVAPSTAPTTLEPTTSTTIVGSASADAMGFAPVDPPELQTMTQPYVAPPEMGNGSMERMAIFHSNAGVLHVMYTNGDAVVSVYEQRGVVRWDALSGGTTMTLGDDQAWAMRDGADEVVVVARGPMVYTIVATAPHDMTMAMAGELPRPGDASMTDRAQAACRSVVARFALSD